MARNAYRPTAPRRTTRRLAVAAVAGLALLGAVAGCNGKTDTSSAPHHGSSAQHGSTATANPAPSSAKPSAHGDGGGAGTGGQAQVVQLTATQQMRFQPAKVEVHPGRVTVRVHNTGSMPHQWQVKGISGASIAIVLGGETESVTFSVPRTGSFQMECSWHAQHGMTGTFVVRGGHS